MSAEPVRAYVGIGEVIAQLRAEFPDLSVSKIRFLEAEGLVTPARAPSGYRRFTPPDVERLRYVLTQQRDTYLPLRVIRDQLAAGEEDEDAPPPSRKPMSRRELLDAVGIADAQLTELEDYGLIQRVGGRYPPEAAEVAQVIMELADHGVRARHVRVLRASAEREMELIEQMVAPLLRQRSDGARDRAGQLAREIASLTLRAHAALIGMALADAGFGERDGQG